MAKLSKAQIQKLKDINSDPVKWAQVFLVGYDKTLKKETPWTARWYQAQMLRDQSKKKVYRCGRRTGKCISEDSLILDYKTGEQITAKELYERQKANLVTLTEDYKLTGNFTNCIFDNGIKDVYRVTTSSGRYIDATGNHPLFTGKGWTEIDDLQKGQLIAIPQSLNYFGNKEIDVDTINSFVRIINESNQKTIPKEIFQTTKKNISIFLSRLYATDGWAYSSDKKKRRIEIGYCSVSEQLIRDIQHLLLRFGINSHIQKKRVKYKDDIRIAYQLLIYRKKDAIKFCNEIGIYGKEEAINKLLDTLSYMNEYEDYLPKEILEFVEEDRIAQGLHKKDLCLNKNDRIRYNYDIQRSKLKHYGEVLNNEDIINFSQGEYLFEEIKSIEYIGKKQTYDFSIPETMNFVVNDIITHNSECMVIEALYNACRRRNYRVLLITPYENQIRLLFQRINELRNSSPLLDARVVSSTKNPYKIEFDNGSLIMGFTTGASSGNSGASIN